MTDELDLRASRARIVAASHARRRAIERTLHDGAQQHLVAISVKLRLAEAEVDSDPEQAKRTLEELRGEVQSTIQHLRDLAHQIYPPLLADRGLREALNGAAVRSPVPVDLTVAGDGMRRYRPEAEAAVYFSVLEAIEAAGGPISVWVGEEAGRLLFEVWGELAEGPALLIITDLTETTGGSVTVEPAESGGLHVRGWAPC
ncbi:MAG TPA: histidine kinase [Acidimicrobiales bacterium]|nr:histidine kinase [Acidimicrobiales bacterium]